MKNFLLKFLLSIVCLLGSINVSAYDFEVDGLYYDVVSLSDFTCKLIGGEDPFNQFKGDFVIPSHVSYANKTLTVVGLRDKLFSGRAELTGITIPNTILSLGDCMFSDCVKLERVKIEDGTTTLDIHAATNLLRRCPVKSLYIGRNLSDNFNSSTSPFHKINTITELTIGNSVTKISSYAFYFCESLTSVTIGNSVKKIGGSAFNGCSSLTSVTIPNSVTEIELYAFCGCI